IGGASAFFRLIGAATLRAPLSTSRWLRSTTVVCLSGALWLPPTKPATARPTIASAPTPQIRADRPARDGGAGGAGRSIVAAIDGAAASSPLEIVVASSGLAVVSARRRSGARARVTGVGAPPGG